MLSMDMLPATLNNLQNLVRCWIWWPIAVPQPVCWSSFLPPGLDGLFSSKDSSRWIWLVITFTCMRPLLWEEEIPVTSKSINLEVGFWTCITQIRYVHLRITCLLFKLTKHDRLSSSSSVLLTKFSSSPSTSFPSPLPCSHHLSSKLPTMAKQQAHLSLEAPPIHLPHPFLPIPTAPAHWSLRAPIRWIPPGHGLLPESRSPSWPENKSSMSYNWSKLVGGWPREIFKWGEQLGYQDRQRRIDLPCDRGSFLFFSPVVRFTLFESPTHLCIVWTFRSSLHKSTLQMCSCIRYFGSCIVPGFAFIHPFDWLIDCSFIR